ncbi:MAG: Gfo/Idh/MocA family oxidoreductase [Gammaproteobacteria bacterium]|nr:Gfo/Idh/MocA family oxidoreductase [Gammaproteobacteria bacterium]
MSVATARIAVLGTGRWGRNLVRNFAELGALAALCDSAPALTAPLAARYPGTAVYHDLDALLADGSVDAVAIATPSRSHGALARRVLEAGKSVFVEKPLSMDLAEAGDLRRLAAAGRGVVMVGHLLLYHPAFVALREHVGAGGIGALRYLYSHRLNFRSQANGDDALWDFVPHDLSMILALAQALPVRVMASGGPSVHPGVADTLLAHFTFAGGLQAHVFASWVHPYKDQRLVVVGEGGMIVFDDVLPGPKKLLLFPHEVEWTGEVPSINRAEAIPIAYASAEPLALECRHFLDCVVSRRPPLSDVEDGYRVVAVLEACERSLAAGLPVQPNA